MSETISIPIKLSHPLIEYYADYEDGEITCVSIVAIKDVLGRPIYACKDDLNQIEDDILNKLQGE